ncbi:MAG: Na(+)/H(+) antiporter subunit D [Gammaproteobacteria bacterium]|nr:MAG: Na(+)/H(+) antiporter subunit D [Gammaproteobacteria bacterium]
MFETVLPPALLFYLAAALIAWGPSRAARPLALLAPLAALALVWGVGDGVRGTVPLLGWEAVWLEGDAVRRLFATIFAIMAFGGALFALRQAPRREIAAALAYAGSAVGVCFAGDLLVLFVFWELMALFSTLVIWHGGTPTARRAGLRYAVLHLLGGVLLKAGILAVWVQTGSLEVRALTGGDWPAVLVLAGVLINAAAPPVSAWIADAYPEATPWGAVFLSAFTTKTAVLALILLFPGEPILVWVGLWMIFYGILYALLENDMRRILAYSVVNQVGFMVVGVGIGSALAINGAAAHAFTHILYKALLFMSAGAVLYQTGRRKCSELGGLFQSMPLTTVCGTVGALSISAFPLTSGFVSKSLTVGAAAGQGLTGVWLALVAASAGVFLHAGIKFPWFVFFQKDSGLRPPDPPWNMRWAMVLFSLACLLLGVFPGLLYALLPAPVDYVPYTAEHVVTQLQLLLFAGLAFFVMLPLMRRTPTITLDFDWFWRVAGPRVYRALLTVLAKAGAAARRLFETAAVGLRAVPVGRGARETTAMALLVLLVFALQLGLALFCSSTG